jgi:hypothetical protein
MDEAEFAASLPDSTVRRLKRLPRFELNLKLDLREPRSALMRQARDSISAQKTIYDLAHKSPRKPPPPVRRRLDTYDACLRVWDLRALGTTFAEIGERLFPGQQATAQRAADIFKRAKKLVNGGYKELR